MFKNELILSNIVKIGVQMSKIFQDGPKWSKNIESIQNSLQKFKGYETIQNCPKWSIIVKNSPKCHKINQIFLKLFKIDKML